MQLEDNPPKKTQASSENGKFSMGLQCQQLSECVRSSCAMELARPPFPRVRSAAVALTLHAKLRSGCLPGDKPPARVTV